MASIKCAHCKETHASVAEVRACAAASRHPVGTHVGGGENFAASYPYHLANEVRKAAKGSNTFSDLCAPTGDEPNWNWGSKVQPDYNSTALHFSGNRRSDFPDMRQVEDSVPAGWYAIGQTEKTTFVKIDKPTEGRWAGYTFIKRQVSDDYYPVKAQASRYDMLRQILAAGVQESMERYGREIGRCGHCDRTLTNEESRKRGIGPICADKMGW